MKNILFFNSLWLLIHRLGIRPHLLDKHATRLQRRIVALAFFEVLVIPLGEGELELVLEVHFGVVFIDLIRLLLRRLPNPTIVPCSA